MQGWIPRPLIIAAIVLVSVVELVFRVPDLLLIKERYDAQKAEYVSKLVLPDTARAQLMKAEADAQRSVWEAKAAQWQPDTAKAQAKKAGFDADAAKYQPDLTAAQLKRADNEADASAYQPAMTVAQLAKAKNEAKASDYQPDLATLQFEKAGYETQAAAFQPNLAQLQSSKLAIDTRIASISLPLTEQSIALSGAFMQLFVGGLAGTANNGGNAPQKPHVDTTSGAYKNGEEWRKQWFAYRENLSAEAEEGVEYWERLKSDPKTHTCAEGKPHPSPEFLNACLYTFNFFRKVDVWYGNDINFRAGWDSKS
jgi:hypothetical protein